MSRTLLWKATILSALAEGRVSVLSLLVVNLFPLVGVLTLGWSVFDVVFIYWLENLIIGVITALKMITCAPSPEHYDLGDLDERGPGELTTEEKLAEAAEFREKFGVSGGAVWHLSKLFFVPFFLVHYGGFCLGHGMFLCFLLGGDGVMGNGVPSPIAPAREAISQPGIQICAAALAVSHLISYFVNYLGRGEYRRMIPPTLMFQPYGRIIVLHLAILFGGLLIFALGSPVVLLVLLVLGKTILDLQYHLREHQAATADPAEGAMTD